MKVLCNVQQTQKDIVYICCCVPISCLSAIIQEMYAWRDKVARTEDESTAFVLPNHMLLKICAELPREMQVSTNLMCVCVLMCC